MRIVYPEKKEHVTVGDLPNGTVFTFGSESTSRTPKVYIKLPPTPANDYALSLNSLTTHTVSSVEKVIPHYDATLCLDPNNTNGEERYVRPSEST